MKKILALALCVLLVLALTACGQGEVEPSQEPAPSPALSDEPGQEVEGANLHHVVIDIADYGTIELELDGDAAPITVDNFLKLAGEGYYDGLTFHRIMEGFMMQGGAPKSVEDMSDPIYGEFLANGWDNPISHVRGVISMARAQDFDSATSQFFIVHKDSLRLDGQYAAFGWVTEGMDVVDAVCESSQPIDDNGTIPADQQPVITSITVID